VIFVLTYKVGFTLKLISALMYKKLNWCGQTAWHI